MKKSLPPLNNQFTKSQFLNPLSNQCTKVFLTQPSSQFMKRPLIQSLSLISNLWWRNIRLQLISQCITKKKRHPQFLIQLNNQLLRKKPLSFMMSLLLKKNHQRLLRSPPQPKPQFMKKSLPPLNNQCTKIQFPNPLSNQCMKRKKHPQYHSLLSSPSMKKYHTQPSNRCTSPLRFQHLQRHLYSRRSLNQPNSLFTSLKFHSLQKLQFMRRFQHLLNNQFMNQLKYQPQQRFHYMKKFLIQLNNLFMKRFLFQPNNQFMRPKFQHQLSNQLSSLLKFLRQLRLQFMRRYQHLLNNQFMNQLKYQPQQRHLFMKKFHSLQNSPFMSLKCQLQLKLRFKRKLNLALRERVFLPLRRGLLLNNHMKRRRKKRSIQRVNQSQLLREVSILQPRSQPLKEARLPKSRRFTRSNLMLRNIRPLLFLKLRNQA